MCELHELKKEKKSLGEFYSSLTNEQHVKRSGHALLECQRIYGIRRERERQRERITANELRKKKQNMLQPYSAVHLRKYCQFVSSTAAECIWAINWP